MYKLAGKTQSCHYSRQTSIAWSIGVPFTIQICSHQKAFISLSCSQKDRTCHGFQFKLILTVNVKDIFRWHNYTVQSLAFIS